MAFSRSVFLMLAASAGAIIVLGKANYARSAEDGAESVVTSVNAVEATAEPDRDPVAAPQIQVGPWSPTPFNIEEPFINILHASSVSWTEKDADNTQELYESGILDEKTGLPKSLPNGWMRSGVYFSTWPDRSHWAGDWVLEWETEKPGDANLGIHWLPINQQRRVRRNRVEFWRTKKNDHAAIAVRGLKSPLLAVRMFRKKNEKALRAGKIYNPRFIEEVRKYHVVRTMDLQEANRAAITQVNEMATTDACCWNNLAWSGAPRRTDHPFRGLPLEAIFAVAVEADNILWHLAPLELGSPKRFYDADIMDPENNRKVVDAWRAHARENAETALASEEWDKYADKFVAALIKSNYPEDRVLYTTVSNEVWNLALYYVASTHYAWGLGEGLQEGGNYRHGYGAALGRWKLALDAALARAGRVQPVIYVSEGQAASPGSTRQSLSAMKRFLEQHDERWEDHSSQIGISVASYWGGGPNWEATASQAQWQNAGDREAQALEERILNGPDSEFATKAWILKRFQGHAETGAAFGVNIIGAYEGGAHLERPKYVPKDFYEDWMWGEHGAKVNKEVNDALAAAYPGIILSNYVMMGPPGGKPWFDAEYGEANELSRSWAAYHRSPSAAETP